MREDLNDEGIFNGELAHMYIGRASPSAHSADAPLRGTLIVESCACVCMYVCMYVCM